MFSLVYLPVSLTFYRSVYFLAILITTYVVHKLEAVLVTTEDIRVVSTTGKFMADVFLFFSRARKGERERLDSRFSLLHDIAGLHGKPGVVFAVIAARYSVTVPWQRTHDTNISRIILPAKCLRFTIHATLVEHWIANQAIIARAK